MPTRPPVPGVLKHQVMFRWRGDWCVSTFRVSHGGVTPTQAMVDADRAVLHGWLVDFWAGNATSQVVARAVKSWSLETVIPTKFDDLNWYPLTHVQGSGGDCLMGTTMALSLRTGAAGTVEKPPNGRLYHVGGPRTSAFDQQTNILGTTEHNALKSAYANLIDLFTGVGNVGTWVLVSYWAGGTRAVPVLRGAPAVLPITHILSDGKLDFQRRRKPRQQAFTVN